MASALHPALNKSNGSIEREFQQLPNPYAPPGLTVEQFPEFSEGLKPENAYKNRYCNILPNNETRVKLVGRSNDYINANYCLNGRVILCQGPKEEDAFCLHSPHADFYHMLWTNNSTAIAMLTDYKENGAEKCSFYLPRAGETKIAGEYSISLCQENEQDATLREQGILITKFFIARAGNQERRIVTHYHHRSWFDSQGTTGQTVATLAKILLKETCPIIHCSAGIGRSGTLTAVMGAYERMAAGDCSTSLVPEVTSDLRVERRGCIQTADQYKTVHVALEVLAVAT